MERIIRIEYQKRDSAIYHPDVRLSDYVVDYINECESRRFGFTPRWSCRIDVYTHIRCVRPMSESYKYLSPMRTS